MAVGVIVFSNSDRKLDTKEAIMVVITVVVTVVVFIVATTNILFADIRAGESVDCLRFTLVFSVVVVVILVVIIVILNRAMVLIIAAISQSIVVFIVIGTIDSISYG